MTDLRSRTIRLAYADPSVRPYLIGLLATDRVAYEFSTQEALDKYLKIHPDADRSKHKVKSEGVDSHGHGSGSTLGEKLKEHVQHILFDDVKEVWSESKEAFEDIVTAVKPTRKNRARIVQSLKEANEATRAFFGNRRYRRKKMQKLGHAIKKGARALADRIAHSVKAEVHEAWEGVKSLKQVLTPGSPPLEKKQKKALYGLGAYVAGAAVAAAGGGVLMASAAVAKSFSLHVGIKAVSHLADAFAVHYEWGAEAAHVGHALPHFIGQHAFELMSHVAADKTKSDEGGDDEDANIVEAMVLSVSKILSDGMSDDDVKRMLSGADDDEYDDSEDNPALDKLKSKADEAAKKGDAKKGDAKKEAALRGNLIRLAHSRPDLRPHLLPVITGSQK